jgi:ornithine cyclodeaminase
MKLLSTRSIKQLVREVGLIQFNRLVLEAQERDFRRWREFHKSPRHAVQYPEGVMELMPCSDSQFYAFKYVNGHPGNTRRGRLSVVALGMLADVETGYPLLLSEMTLLTAFRTGATTALGARYLARPDLQRVAIIGTGAQSEFQVMALKAAFPIHTVRFFDIDPGAMDKFFSNIQGEFQEVIPCDSAAEAVAGTDMVITATADRRKAKVLTSPMVNEGTHIHAMGGDCPGKTELDPDLLDRSKVVVEYLDQSRSEGEIQNRPAGPIHAELWEIVSGVKPGRETDEEITLLDSVGFALEDFSILKLIHQLAREMDMAEEAELIPSPADPKDLYGVLI